MYPNLDAEMARIGLTRKALSKELDMTPTTLTLKLNGKANLTLAECLRIRSRVSPSSSIEYLFQQGK